MKILSCTISLLLIIATGVAQESFTKRNRIVVGKNILVSADKQLTPHIEPFLAIDSSMGIRLLGCSMTFDSDGYLTTNVFVSSDLGNTWVRKAFPESSGDPWVAVSRQGVWYLSCLGRAKERTSPLVVYTSTDRGNTWTRPVTVPQGNGRSFDRPSMALGSGACRERVYVIASQSMRTRDSSLLVSPVLSWSDDQGLTFQTPQRIVMSNVWANAVNPVVMSDGKLFLTFVDYALHGEPIQYKRVWGVVTEGGKPELSIPRLVSEAAKPGSPWMLALDQSAGHTKDRLYLVSTYIGETAKNVVVSHSDDKGISWSPPVRVNHTPLRNDYFATAAITVNGEGVVAVTWFDKGTGDNCWALHFSASVDGGKSFSPSVQVSSVESCPDSVMNSIRRSDGTSTDVMFRWPSGGDYSGLCSTRDGVFHVLWCDARTGVFQLWYSTVTVGD